MRRPGEAFQAAVKHSADVYKLRGWGVVEEVPVPYSQVGTVAMGSNQGRPIIQRLQSTVDFSGHMWGIPVAMECKSFSQDRMVQASGSRVLVHPHQTRYLDSFIRTAAASSRPAVAFFLVEFRTSAQVFAVPPAWYTERIQGRKSIPLQEIADHCTEVPVGTRGVPVDFAVAVKLHVEQWEGASNG